MDGAGPCRRILALDGGGIRGIITARWLARLEEVLGGPVARRFDILAGTSTGAILACAVARGIPAADIVEMYRRHGREVFPPPGEAAWSWLRRAVAQAASAPIYDGVGLERVLRRQLGEVLLGDLPARPLLLLTAFNTLTRTMTVIKHDRPRWAAMPLWQAAKASSSAPVYFPAHVTGVLGSPAPLIDGGVAANNPAACALAEAVRVNRANSGTDTIFPQGDGTGTVAPTVEGEYGICPRISAAFDQFVVASFGTGHATRPITVEQARQWGPLEWALPILNLLMDGSGDVVDYLVGQLIPPGRYFRLQVPLDAAHDEMDDAGEANIDALLAAAETCLAGDGERKIQDLARLLGEK